MNLFKLKNYNILYIFKYFSLLKKKNIQQNETKEKKSAHFLKRYCMVKTYLNITSKKLETGIIAGANSFLLDGCEIIEAYKLCLRNTWGLPFPFKH